MQVAEKSFKVIGSKVKVTHINFVNSVDLELMTGFKPKLTPVLKYCTWKTNLLGFEGRVVKDQGRTCTRVRML